MDNLNILVEAKREYLEQLSILICPVMIDVFDEMFQEAQKLSKGRKVLIMFQNLLRDVPNWSETMAKENTDNIANRCAWFKDLVAAVFVSSVKILSAVRLSKDSKKLSVKLPSNEVFIHTCYKNVAKDLYKNPYVFTDNQTEHDRNDRLYERFSSCVEATVKELIPVQQILQTYMTAQNDEIIEPHDGNIEDDNIDEYEDEETFPGPVEPQEIPSAPTEPTGTQETLGESVVPLGGEVRQEPPVGLENEFRTINNLKKPQSNPEPEPEPEPEPDEDEDLFPDATETRTRKPL